MDDIIKYTELMITRRNHKIIRKNISNKFIYIISKDVVSEILYLTYLCKEEKVTVNIINQIIEISSINNCENIIIVYMNSLTPEANNIVKLNDIEIIEADLLSFDLVMVINPHLKLNDIQDIKERNKLPIILSTDVVSKYYGFKSGDIIQILENDDTFSIRRCV